MAQMIDIEEVKAWRLNRIQSGEAHSYDDMTALKTFLDNAKTVDIGHCSTCVYSYNGMLVADGYCRCQKHDGRYIKCRWCSEWRSK